MIGKTVRPCGFLLQLQQAEAEKDTYCFDQSLLEIVHSFEHGSVAS